MRPAGELVKAAKQFDSRITISKDGKQVIVRRCLLSCH